MIWEIFHQLKKHRNSGLLYRSPDDIWLIGGYRTASRILSFKMNEQNFTVLPIELNQGRYYHQCTFIPGTRYIVVTGGQDKDYNRFATSEIIDVGTRSVTEGPPMNSRRLAHGIGVLNIDNLDRVAVFGGFDGTDYLKSVEMYNPQTQKMLKTSALKRSL